MKKLIVLSTLITATFSAQAAELYLYAGAGLKILLKKLSNNLKKKLATTSRLNTVAQDNYWHAITR